MTYCEKCGTKNRDDVHFCAQCGAYIYPTTAGRGENWEKREMCFGIPGMYWPIVLGIILILAGITAYFEVEFFPFLLGVIGIMVIAGAFLRSRRR